MDIDFQRWIDYLDSLGVRDVPHTKHTYFGHLTAVYRYLKQQGCSEDVYKAGLFHSIYGTEGFQEFKLPLDRRDEVRALIGGRAEMLAYLNCAVDRATLDREALRSTPSYHITDRITGDEVTLSREDFDDLCRVHFYDMLEVVPHGANGIIAGLAIAPWPNDSGPRRSRSMNEFSHGNRLRKAEHRLSFLELQTERCRNKECSKLQ